MVAWNEHCAQYGKTECQYLQTMYVHIYCCKIQIGIYWRCGVYTTLYTHHAKYENNARYIANCNYTLLCWARCIVRLRRLQDEEYCSTLRSCAISDILRTPTILFKRQHTQFDLGKCRYHFAQTSKRNKIIQQKYIYAVVAAAVRRSTLNSIEYYCIAPQRILVFIYICMHMYCVHFGTCCVLGRMESCNVYSATERKYASAHKRTYINIFQYISVSALAYMSYPYVYSITNGMSCWLGEIKLEMKPTEKESTNFATNSRC